VSELFVSLGVLLFVLDPMDPVGAVTGSGLGVTVMWTMSTPVICVEVMRSSRYIKRGLGTTSHVVATPAGDYTNYETETSDKSPYAYVSPTERCPHAVVEHHFNFLVKKLVSCCFLEQCRC